MLVDVEIEVDGDDDVEIEVDEDDDVEIEVDEDVAMLDDESIAASTNTTSR